MIVNLDEASFAQANPGLGKANAIGVGNASCRNQYTLGTDFATIRKLNSDILAVLCGRLRAGTGEDGDALRAEHFLEDCSDIWVFTIKDVLARSDHSDLRTEGRHHRGKLDADVSAANDCQRGRNFFKTQDIFAIPCAGFPQTWNRRVCGARSEVEKDFVGVELACRTVFQSHFDAVRVEEPGASTHEVDAGGSEELLMRGDHR